MNMFASGTDEPLRVARGHVGRSVAFPHPFQDSLFSLAE